MDHSEQGLEDGGLSDLGKFNDGIYEHDIRTQSYSNSSNVILQK